MNENPWDLLGLDPHRADLQALRVSYARLVKQHRPDRDPAGFQRIHHAYEQARWMLAMRQRVEEQEPALTAEAGAESEGASNPQSPDPPAGTPDPPAGALPPAPAAPTAAEADAPLPSQPAPGPEPSRSAPVVQTERAPALPSPFEECLGRIRAAQEQNQEGLIARELLQMREFWRRQPALLEPWSALLEEVANSHPRVVIALWEPEDSILEVRRGSSALTEAVVELCVKGGTWDRLEAIGTRFLEGSDELPSWVGPQAMLACARALALNHPSLARRLADRAYRLMAPAQRGQTFRDLDLQLAIGLQICGLAVGERRALAQCLATGHAEIRSREVKRAMRGLYGLRNAKLAQDHIFGRFPHCQAAVRPRFRRFFGAGREAQPAASSGLGSGGVAILAMVFCLLGFFGRSMDKGGTPSERRFSAPKLPRPLPAHQPPALAESMRHLKPAAVQSWLRKRYGEEHPALASLRASSDPPDLMRAPKVPPGKVGIAQLSALLVSPEEALCTASVLNGTARPLQAVQVTFQLIRSYPKPSAFDTVSATVSVPAGATVAVSAKLPPSAGVDFCIALITHAGTPAEPPP